ncbi:FecCD family ABC transporter permease [Christensenella tenuis]|jgi:iron complex transport system permease protein|uniref:Iron ABC transporter permease n=1 Tax=Christensenella tenuis TaxID=2763033 RepID=A0ABR7EI86_9FIRM|nr:iron ABC transporter permease [Christensenella tenuis]MBC5649500.1 iron ABC transporter permease [Christensenella tenuis]
MKKGPVKFQILLLVLILGGAAAFVCAFFVGSSGFSVAEFGKILDGTASSTVHNIFLNIRLPRAIGAFLVGAALAVSGCCLQGVFKNPMADSFVLGISSGSALGATVAMTFMSGMSIFGAGTIAVFSFAGALAAVFIVYNISRIRGKVSTFSLLLSGFSMSAMFSAIIYLIMLLNRDKMENVVMWNMGSLANMTWDKIWIALPAIIVCSGLLMFYAKPLNIMLNGDEVSQSLGVDTHKTRRNMLILTSLLSAVAVSISGIIGFVGLMVPHLLRMIAGPDNKKLLPLCFAGGGMYLLFCDVIARVILNGQEMPVGIVTSILGVPFFIFLLRRGNKGGI